MLLAEYPRDCVCGGSINNQVTVQEVYSLLAKFNSHVNSEGGDLQC